MKGAEELWLSIREAKFNYIDYYIAGKRKRESGRGHFPSKN